MKITTNTVNVLKNFAKINPSIIINEGKVLKTVNNSKTIMGTATVDTEFPQKFAIYNLDRFISTLSLFSDPELTFNEKYVEVSDGSRKTKYVYSEESSIQSKAPDKEIKLPSVDVSFKMGNDDLRDVEKASSILSLPEIVVAGDGSNVKLQTEDTKVSTSDVHSVSLGDTDKTFKAIFKTENIKILPGDYEVSISKRGISKFEGVNFPYSIEYFIAVEQHSTYED